MWHPVSRLLFILISCGLCDLFVFDVQTKVSHTENYLHIECSYAICSLTLTSGHFIARVRQNPQTLWSRSSLGLWHSPRGWHFVSHQNCDTRGQRRCISCIYHDQEEATLSRSPNVHLWVADADSLRRGLLVITTVYIVAHFKTSWFPPLCLHCILCIWCIAERSSNDAQTKPVAMIITAVSFLMEHQKKEALNAEMFKSTHFTWNKVTC